jgi:exonuclease SbcC
MIKRLFLQHWKSHEKTELKFSDGANLLVGGMGSGKSSCMDAICYGFFGTFPALKSRRVSLQDVITRNRNFCRVELEFESESRNYIISRSFGKSSKSELRVDGSVVETQSQRISEFVENILGIDYELFTRAVYSEQNKIEYFLDLQKGERKRQLDDLIGISVFELVRSNVSSLINKLKSSKAELGFLSDANYEELKKKHEYESNEVVSIEKNIKEKEQRQKELFQSLESVEKKLDELKSKKQRHLSMLNDKTSVLSQLSLIEKKIESLPAFSQNELKDVERERSEVEKLQNRIEKKRNLENQLSGLNGEINSFKKEAVDEAVVEKLEANEKEKTENENQLEKLRSALTYTKEKNRVKTSEVEKLKKELENIEKEKPELEELTEKINLKSGELNEKQKEKFIANEKVTENQKIIELLKIASGKCPTCGADLTEEHRSKTIKSKTKELEDLKEKLKTLDLEVEINFLKKLEERKNALQADCGSEEEKRNLFNSLSKELNEIEEKRLSRLVEERKTALSRLNNEIGFLMSQKFKLEKQNMEEKKVEAAREKRKRVEEELKSLKNVDVGELKTKLEALSKLIEINSLLKEKTEKTEKLKLVETAIKELDFNEQALSNLEAQKIKSKEDVAENNAVLGGLKQRMKDEMKLVEEFERQRNAIEEKIKRSGELENKIEKGVKFGELITSLQIRLREDLIQAVNEVLEIIWKSVYPYNDYSSIVIMPTESDYCVKLKNEAMIDVDDVSGGERACAAIALRIALAVTLAPKLKWLILDEPTHNLDMNAVLLLSNALKDNSGIGAVTSQVFIITHDETLKSGFDSYYLFDRRKDENGSTVVEKITIV